MELEHLEVHSKPEWRLRDKRPASEVLEALLDLPSVLETRLVASRKPEAEDHPVYQTRTKALEVMSKIRHLCLRSAANPRASASPLSLAHPDRRCSLSDSALLPASAGGAYSAHLMV